MKKVILFLIAMICLSLAGCGKIFDINTFTAR